MFALKPRPTDRVLIVIASAFCLVLSMYAGIPTSRGQEPAAQEATAPPTTDLLRSPPFDRITLTDGTVLIIDPVSPRPLPTPDPTKTKRSPKARLSRTKTEVPLGGNIGLPGEPSKFKTPQQEKEEETDEDEANRKIKIHLLTNAEVRDYEVKRSNIKTIEYFEDMLLAEGDRLVLARDFARAFECYMRVKLRNPDWPGLDDHVNRLLYAEGSAALIAGDSDRGLRLLRELLARNRDYPGLLDQLAEAYRGWVTRALDLGQFAKGRRILHELELMAPEHRVVSDMRDRFLARANKRLKEGQAREGAARLDALVDALRIWPALSEAERLYKPAFEAVPTLDVAVSSVPAPLGPWVRSPADSRVSRLLYRPILASDSDDARKGKPPGQLASAVELSDLGRRLMIRLKSGIAWSDGSRQVSAVDIARHLIDRTDPSSPKYEARWTDILDRVESPDDTRVEVRLKRPLIKLGSWFGGPVGPAHAGIDGRVAVSLQDRLLVNDGPFRCLGSSETSIELGVARDPSKDEAHSPRSIQRLREFQHTGPKAGIAALVSGDVTLAAHVPPDQVTTLSALPEIKLGRYTQPVVHSIALDGRNRVLKNRSLRRGLSYAIDRKMILEETVLRRPSDAENTVADGPFPKGSYADSPGVKPLAHNMALATMLIAAASKQLGSSPIELKLEYPAIPEAQAVVPVIAEAIRTAGLASGLKIETIERPEAVLESELRAGRTFDLAYRALKCDEPILEAGVLLCPGYDAPPEADALGSAASTRILQLLLELERAAELPTARGLAIQIDRESRDELPVLPLWQVIDHYAWRTRLQGPAQVSDHLYQGIESWHISPWVAKDPWTGK
jgi:peptide/nickel transport system substrate-binding protein